jgi:Protein kinase domain
MAMLERLGEVRCSQVGDQDIELLVTLTRLREQTVLKRLEKAHGNTLVSRAFEAEWPASPEMLAGLTVATARRAGLDLELAHATGLGERAVRNRLEREAGQMLVVNAFPELPLEEEDGEGDAESDGADSERASGAGKATDEGTDADEAEHQFLDGRRRFEERELVGGITVGCVANAPDLLEWLAERARVDSANLRRRLGARHGHGTVQDLLEREWPIKIGDPPRELLASMSCATARRSLSLVRWMAELCGLAPRDALERLQAVHGRKQVLNVLPQLVAAGGRVAPIPDQGSPAAAGIIVDGRYALGRLLGSGGFGRVHEADRLQPPPQKVVIKLGIPGQPDRLLEEIGAAYELTHQNICSYKDYGTDSKLGTYLVLQHGGESLESVIDGAAISLEQALDVVTQAAHGLDYAHSEGVIHQDVKPGNILVHRGDRRWKVRVTDFGIAVTGTVATNIAGHHTILATRGIGYSRGYAAPEQRAGEVPRRGTDQYALALVFCSMLERRVFRDRYRFQPFAALSGAQNDALSKALSLEPEDRFASCSEFVSALAGG